MDTHEDAQTRIQFPAERRQVILETLSREGKVLASELAVALGTSEDTVRRDLKELAEAGLLQRVHGGAMRRSPVPIEHTKRREREVDAKRAIGHAAAALIEPTDVVLLDGGTTTLEVACALPPAFRGTVLTTNLPAAQALADHGGAEVVVLGGKLHKTALECVGPRVTDELARVRADVCFIGATSLDPDLGVGCLDYEDALVKRAMIAAAAKVVAILSAEKLGTASPFLVGKIGEFDCVLTDRMAPSSVVERCRALGVEVLLV